MSPIYTAALGGDTVFAPVNAPDNRNASDALGKGSWFRVRVTPTRNTGVALMGRVEQRQNLSGGQK
jgi:hypothetical protein